MSLALSGRKPTAAQLAQIPELALLLLSKTGEPALRAQWRQERNGAYGVLRETRKEGYFQTVDAEYDLDWLTDALEDIEDSLREPADVEDPGVRQSDFFYAYGGGW